MMVETMLESSQDFGMANGALPQWKRELLQRRAARSRPPIPPPAPPAPPAPAAPAPDEDDEELRYGPGIVKRLKSRYLSLALRDAPRRRPSVLRRATSLEHLLDERPPPAPRPCARAARPASVAAPPSSAPPGGPAPRRDSVKRARSVDALSRLDARDDHPPIPPKPQPPQQHQPPQQQPPPPPPSPPPPLPRAARPPRRPTPLLRETERPPPDVVRSALRKFEAAPPRRPAPAARVSAVLRGLEAPRSSTPEPRGRSPSPAAADLSAIVDPEAGEPSPEAKPVSRAALEGIARAGSTVRYAFEAPRGGSHLPPLAATNPVLLGRARLSPSPRRVGVIRPMPSPALDFSAPSPPPSADEDSEKTAEEPPRESTPPHEEPEPTPVPRPERREPPPSALVEPIPRSAPEDSASDSTRPESDSDASAGADRDDTPEPEPRPRSKPQPQPQPLVNGHAEKSRDHSPKTKMGFSRIGAADIERAWTGAGDKRIASEQKEKKENGEVKCAWGAGGGAARRGRGAPPPAATSVVFNFSGRKEVPDYIENDGIILRANRRNRFKAGEPGIVVLRPEALAADTDSDGDGDGDGEVDGRPPSPCGVRFVNDNVLINGRSSMPPRPNKDRIAKLKLQFDDSLTRTFEYPSEISLCEESPASPPPAAAPAAPAADVGENGVEGDSDGGGGGEAGAGAGGGLLAPLAANTHIVSAALARYTPSKTLADTFELGLAPHPPHPPHVPLPPSTESEAAAAAAAGGAAGGEAGDARPCAADAARSWSEARSHATDLLF